ncbi:hypothetical protein MMC30_003067 [Trapelia coarctata]|nr:hypothetical protein [Trapelia coarctata]
MAPSKKYVPTGRSPGRPRKVARGLSKVVGSAVTKSSKTTTPIALRSGRVYAQKEPTRKVSSTNNGGNVSNETTVKRGRGRPKKVVEVESTVDGNMPDGATNREIEEVQEGEDGNAEEDVDGEAPIAEVKRGRGRPKKIVSEVLSGEADETAEATANGAAESIEIEDETTEEAVLGGPSTIGIKRGRGRPKKESNVIGELAPSSPVQATVATVATVKRGKGRPPKKKRASYFGRPVPALPQEESVHEGEQEVDGADEGTSLFVETGSDHMKATADRDDNSSSPSSSNGNAKVPKLLPSLISHSAGKSPSPSHRETLHPNHAGLDAIGRPKRHGVFKGKVDDDDDYQLASADEEETAPSGPLTIFGREGIHSDGLEGIGALVEGT